MRIPSWKALVHGLLCAAFCGSIATFGGPAAAQDALPPQGAYPPGYAAGMEAMAEPMLGPGIYGSAEGPPPNAWPGVNPYPAGNYERLANERGIWEYEDNRDQRRKYKFGIDYIQGWGVKPGPQVLIGDPNAYLHAYPTDDEFDIPFTRLTNADYGEAQPFSFWPARFTNWFGDLCMNGIRANFGWEIYDHQEFQVSGFALFEATQQFTNYGGDRTADDIDLNIFRLPLFDGTEFGTTIPYDSFLDLRYRQQVYGIDFDYWSSPFYDSKNFMVRMELGVKYLYIKEQFRMQAGDSGLDYQYNAEDGTITPEPPPLPLFPDGALFSFIDPFVTTINSQVTSNLVGPMIGARADLGGDKFKIWGQVKFGALANMETSTVWSQNVRPQVLQSIYGPGPTSSRTREHTYITPVFQTGINGEFGFMSYLPIIKQIPIINLSKFRLGYDYTLIGALSRPAQVLQYNVDVIDLKTKRQNFSIKTLNFGLGWDF
ncbi:MAG: hypothetical protein ACK5UC_04050 [Planctomycetaceae bacterium]|jgi:hypothetical protein